MTNQALEIRASVTQALSTLRIAPNETMVRQRQFQATGLALIRSGMSEEMFPEVYSALLELDPHVFGEEQVQKLNEFNVPSAHIPVLIRAYTGLSTRYLEESKEDAQIGGTVVMGEVEAKEPEAGDAASEPVDPFVASLLQAATDAVATKHEHVTKIESRVTQSGQFNPEFGALLYHAFLSHLGESELAAVEEGHFDKILDDAFAEVPEIKEARFSAHRLGRVVSEGVKIYVSMNGKAELSKCLKAAASKIVGRMEANEDGAGIDDED